MIMYLYTLYNSDITTFIRFIIVIIISGSQSGRNRPLGAILRGDRGKNNTVGAETLNHYQ